MQALGWTHPDTLHVLASTHRNCVQAEVGERGTARPTDTSSDGTVIDRSNIWNTTVE